MQTFDLVIKGGDAILPGHGRTTCDIAIHAGKIAAILAPGVSAPAHQELSARGLVLMPSAVDVHLHLGHGKEIARLRAARNRGSPSARHADKVPASRARENRRAGARYCARACGHGCKLKATDRTGWDVVFKCPSPSTFCQSPLLPLNYSPKPLSLRGFSRSAKVLSLSIASRVSAPVAGDM